MRELGIKRKDVEAVVLEPAAVDQGEYPHIAVATHSKSISLVVVYKNTEMGYKVITFFSATKGRYEDKILQRG